GRSCRSWRCRPRSPSSSPSLRTPPWLRRPRGWSCRRRSRGSPSGWRSAWPLSASRPIRAWSHPPFQSLRRRASPRQSSPSSTLLLFLKRPLSPNCEPRAGNFELRTLVPLLTLDKVSLAFGHLPLFQAADLRIDAGERIALIGRNGSGKSSLLRVVSGELPADG